MSTHERYRPQLVLAGAVGSAALAGWAILMASQALTRSFSLIVYMLANLIVFLDAFDFCLRLYFRRIHGGATGELPTSVALEPRRFTTYQKRLHLQAWAIVVSVHNAENELDEFVEAMEAVRDHVWVIDDGSADNTCLRLRQAGFRCLEGGQNRHKPGAIRFLLASLPPEIETVIVLDPDTVLLEAHPNALAHMEEVIFDFQRSGMAALCPRVAVRRDGFLARFQALEYWLSFSLGRKSLADHSLTSGISLYRRSALAAALERHSLSVYAEDFENSILLLDGGERIYYDSRIVVETEGERTWRRWFSQRVGWAYGLARVYFARFGEIWRFSARSVSAEYQFVVYLGVFSLLLQPLKLLTFVLLMGSFATGVDSLLGLGWLPYSTLTDPVYFLAAFTKYALLTFVALLVAVPREERRYVLPIAPLYFLYALAQVIPTTAGYANWCTLRFWGRRLVHDHYQDENSLLRQQREQLAAR